jgi:hypothetical protein
MRLHYLTQRKYQSSNKVNKKKEKKTKPKKETKKSHTIP